MTDLTATPCGFNPDVFSGRVTPEQLSSITSPEVLYILKTIKQMQHRMKDPEIIELEFIRIYDKLSYEFDDFFTRYTGIFARVVKGEKLDLLASVLYQKDQVDKGLITEKELADKLAEKYLSKDQKLDSDKRLKVMEQEENKSH